MAFLFADSFDFYTTGSGTNSELSTIGPWTAFGQTPSISTTTRFSQGKALSGNGVNSFVSKSGLTPSTNTAFAAFALQHSSLNGSNTTYYASVHFCQGGTVSTNCQVGIHFRGDGAIEVRRGSGVNQASPGGTLLATFSGAHTAATWSHWQIKFVIGSGTSGAVYLRKNGDATDTYSATGLNTQATANAFIDGLVLGQGVGSTSILDDFLLWDNSGSVLNDWVGDIRAYTLYPSADTSQKDFVAQPLTVLNLASATTIARSANNSQGGKLTSTYSGGISTVRVPLTAAITGDARVYIYTDTGLTTAPFGTLLGSSAIVTNPGVGNVDFAFSTPVPVTKGTNYWVVMTATAAWTAPVASATNSGVNNTNTNITTTSAPNNPASGTVNANGLAHSVVYSFSANAYAVQETVCDGDTTIVTSATVGAIDLYALDDLPTTPSSILAVQARMVTRKSDANARGAAIVLKSGATSDTSSTVLQSTSYTAVMKSYPTDPNTGVAWTASAVNALQIGPKVAS